VSALDQALVGIAVAVSPAAHRDARREQWLADVRDAEQLDLSSTALAFGALTTALFHRRAPHRTSWGNTVTALSTQLDRMPHTVRTIPVLVAVAVVSLIASGAWLIVQPNGGYGSRTDVVLATAGTWTLVFFVPGAAIALAALVLRAPSGRRRLGASIVLAAAVGGVLQPLLTPPTDLPVGGLPLILALAGWLVAVRVRRSAWLLLLLPAVVFVLEWNGVLFSMVPLRWNPFVVTLPPLSAVIAGYVASRFSTEPRLVVEPQAEALVDKSV
jgi:hypothetical protein